MRRAVPVLLLVALLAAAAPPAGVTAVGPRFDVFRRLDPRETPPSIGQVFGEPAIVAVLPSDAPAVLLEGYRALLKSWQSPSQTIDITLDSQISTLPRDRAVWIGPRQQGTDGVGHTGGTVRACQF